MNHRLSKNKFSVSGNSIYLGIFLVFLLLSYVITALGLFLLASLLYKIPLSESAVNIGIVLIYIVSTFAASFLCGKKMKTKKFIWGLFLGITYFLILFIISAVSGQSADLLGSNTFTAFLLCIASGTLGGMLA